MIDIKVLFDINNKCVDLLETLKDGGQVIVEGFILDKEEDVIAIMGEED